LESLSVIVTSTEGPVLVVTVVISFQYQNRPSAIIWVATTGTDMKSEFAKASYIFYKNLLI